MASKNAFLAEDGAVRAILAAVEDGFGRMHAVLDRMLARRPGGKLSPADLKWLDETEQALVKLAGDLAGRSVYKGEYSGHLKEALRKGLHESRGAVINLDAATIRTALYPARLEIKGLFDAGSRAITELTARAMTGGWSPRELSEKIQAEVVLYEEDGTPYGVPEWRAELQAINEPMKVFRQAASSDWTDDTPLEMVGPDDVRTDGDICSDYVGKTMTLAEWEAIVVNAKRGDTCDPRGDGMHPRCRHRWIEVEAAA